MSKVTNDGLIRSGTGRFIAVPIWQQCWRQGVKAHIKGNTVGMRYSEKTGGERNSIMFRRFDVTAECHGQTDGQTDRWTVSRSAQHLGRVHRS